MTDAGLKYLPVVQKLLERHESLALDDGWDREVLAHAVAELVASEVAAAVAALGRRCAICHIEMRGVYWQLPGVGDVCSSCQDQIVRARKASQTGG